ncbi:MAG: sulfur carrier protein ThiS [Planctomycetota bacterium]
MQSAVRITLNGKPRQVRAGTSLADLVLELGLGGAAVAVEKNHALVRARDQSATVLAEGDEIEVVTLVGGG